MGQWEEKSRTRHHTQLPKGKNVNTRFLINCHNKQRGSQYAYLRDLALTMDKCCWCFWFAFPFCVDGDYFCHPRDFQIPAPDGACQVFSEIDEDNAGDSWVYIVLYFSVWFIMWILY